MSEDKQQMIDELVALYKEEYGPRNHPIFGEERFRFYVSWAKKYHSRDMVKFAKKMQKKSAFHEISGSLERWGICPFESKQMYYQMIVRNQQESEEQYEYVPMASTWKNGVRRAPHRSDRSFLCDCYDENVGPEESWKLNDADETVLKCKEAHIRAKIYAYFMVLADEEALLVQSCAQGDWFHRSWIRLILSLPIRELLRLTPHFADKLVTLDFENVCWKSDRSLLRNLYNRGYFEDITVEQIFNLAYPRVAAIEAERQRTSLAENIEEALEAQGGISLSRNGTNQCISDMVVNLFQEELQAQVLTINVNHGATEETTQRMTEIVNTIIETLTGKIDTAVGAVGDIIKGVLGTIVMAVLVWYLHRHAKELGVQKSILCGMIVLGVTIIYRKSTLLRKVIGKILSRNDTEELVAQNDGEETRSWYLACIPAVLLHHLGEVSGALGTLWKSRDIDLICRRLSTIGDNRFWAGLDTIGTWLTAMIKKVKYYVMVKVFRQRSEDWFTAEVDPLVDWFQECETYVMASVDRTGIDSDGALAELKRLYSKGCEFLRHPLYKNRTILIHKVTESILKNAEAMKRRMGSAGSIRSPPVSLYLYGNTGVGKSSITYPLSVMILKEVYKRERNTAMLTSLKKNWRDMIYARASEQEYWDGYTGQMVCVYDDFSQRVDTASAPNIELFEIIRAINIFPYPCHMADISQKANTEFSSKLVIASSNLKDPQTESLNYATALSRRFMYRVEVKRVGRPTGQLSWDDYIFSLDTFDKKSEGARRQISINELVSLLADRYEREGKFVTSVGNFIDTIMADVDTDGEILAQNSEAISEEDPEYWDMSETSSISENETLESDVPLLYDEEMDDITFEELAQIDESEFELGEWEVDWEPEEIPDSRWKKVKIYMSRKRQEIVRKYKEYLDKIKAVEWFKIAEKVGYCLFVVGLVGASFALYKSLTARKQEKIYFDGCAIDLNTKDPFGAIKAGLEKKKQEEFDAENGPYTFENSGNVRADSVFKVLKKGQFEGEIGYLARIKEYFMANPEIVTQISPVDTTEEFQSEVKEYIKKLEAEKYTAAPKRTLKAEGFDVYEKANQAMGFLKAIPGKIGTPVWLRNLWKRVSLKLEDCETVEQYIASRNIFTGIATSNEIINFESIKAERKALEVIAEGSSDIVSQEQIDKIVNSNMYKMVLGWGSEETEELGHCVFVKDQCAVFPNHFRHALANALKREPEAVISFEKPNSGRMFPMKLKDFKFQEFKLSKREYTKDIAFVHVPKANVHRDLTNYFAPRGTLTAVGRSEVLLPVFRKYGKKISATYLHALGSASFVASTDVEYSVQETLEKKEAIKIRESWGYAMQTLPGDCGALLFVLNPAIGPGKVLGVHVAGKKNKGEGVAVAVSAEDIRELLKQYEAGAFKAQCRTFDFVSSVRTKPGVIPEEKQEFHYLGVVPGVCAQPEASKIRKSTIHGYIPPTTAPTWLKPEMKDGQIFDPMEYRQSRMGKESVPISAEDISKAKAAFCNDVMDEYLKIKHVIDGRFPTHYDFETAVCGVSGEPFVNKVKRDTSCGYPLVGMGWTRKKIFGRGEEYDLTTPEAKELKKMVENCEENTRKGILTEHYFIDTLKDERKAIGKEHKTRMFSNGPLDYLIYSKMYYNPIVAVLGELRNKSHVSVGTNPYSDDWDNIAQLLLKKSPLMIAGDFEGFDASEQRELLEASGESLIELSKRILKISEEEETHMRAILQGLLASFHIGRNGAARQWVKSLPSGHYLTAVINSILVNLAACIAFMYAKGRVTYASAQEFFDSCGIVAYGDDHIISVPVQHIEEYNQQTMPDLMKRLGMFYTIETKTLEEITFRARKITEVNYLKRNFIWDELRQRFVAPLSLETILETPQWIRACADPALQTFNNIEFAVTELSLHSEETWNDWFPTLARLSEEFCFKTLKRTDYHETRSLTLNSELKIW